MNVDNMNDYTIISKAADLIEKHGLCKHTRQDSKGRFCVHGAIAYVLNNGEIDEYNDREYLITEQIWNCLGTGIPFNSGIADWNNQKSMNKKIMVKTLRECATKIKKEHRKNLRRKNGS